MSLVEKKLLKSFLTAARPVCHHNSLSVLSCVAISADTKEISFTATDLDVWAMAKVPFDIDAFNVDSTELKPALYDFTTLYGAVQMCTGIVIDVSIHNQELYFNREKVSKSDKLISQYPTFPNTGERIGSGVINRFDTFIRAFKFISSDKTRYFLNGVHLILEDKEIKLESTNGHIALMSESVGETEVLQRTSAIIRDVSKFSKLNLTEFNLYEKTIEYHNSIFTIHMRLIDGIFPNMPRVIPNSANMDWWEVDPIEFREAIERIQIKLKARGFNKKIHPPVILLSNEEIRSECDIPAKSKLQSNLKDEWRFNLDYLDIVIDGTCKLFVPAVGTIRPIRSDNSTYGTIEVLMPMSL